MFTKNTTIMNYIDYDTWFDIFIDSLRGLGYKGPIDKDIFEEDYEEGKTPEEVAKEYFDEYLE